MLRAFICANLLTYLAWVTEGSTCYPNYCRVKTSLANESDIKCSIEYIEKTDECVTLSFENYVHFPPQGEEFAKIQLTTYVKNNSFHSKTTAFNLSISDVNIQKLTTRYQSIGDERISECQQVEILNNITDWQNRLDLFLSCSLANESYETSPFRLEYLVLTDKYEYSRKLVFIIPRHKYIDSDNADVKSYVPFIYADVSDTSELSIYIQPVPSKYKVNSYRIWLINNGTNLVKNVTVASTDDKHIRYDFPVENGVYYFKVASLHSECGSYGCVNSTSPLISIKHTSHRLLIMIISVIWIPPVIFYALFNAYKVYRKNEKLKRAETKSKCLIVYHPTHTLHINVMVDLARYLRGCNIHAMIDILDLPESTNKDPAQWYSEMFHKADIILWAMSPAPNDNFIPPHTVAIEDKILNFVKNYQNRRNKKMYILQFPYCSVTDLPQEFYSLKLFSMPDELEKLVKTINNVDFVRFFGVSNKLFVESVKAATVRLAQEQNMESNKLSEDNDIPLLLKKSSRADAERNEATTFHADECDGNFDRRRNIAEQLKLLNEN